MKQGGCHNAIPYFKQMLEENHEEEQAALSKEDLVADMNFNEDLTITFLVNDSDTGLFKYIQNKDLQAEKIDTETLLEFSINNLYNLAENIGLRIQELEDDCFALLLDGNFEASLILLEGLWEHSLNQYAPDGYAAAVPSRDVLAFCNLKNNEGIQKLRNIIANVWENGDYLLSDKILKRSDGKWSFL